MSKFVILLSAVLGIVITGCNVLIHDEEKAAQAAMDFANVCLIRKDITAAYSTLSDEVKRSVTLSQFQQAMTQMHPSGFPQSITASEFDPIPGQSAINILAEGRNGSESYSYRITMLGTANVGYRVGGIFRATGEVRKSNLGGKLKRPISTPG